MPCPISHHAPCNANLSRYSIHILLISSIFAPDTFYPMNPSNSGWIAKYGHVVSTRPDDYADFESLYEGLKGTGFIYGINVSTPGFIRAVHQLSEDEKAKINLLTGLWYTYRLAHPDRDFESFLTTVLIFYSSLKIGRLSFFNKFFTKSGSSIQLEKLLDSRIYLEDNVISKTFNSAITNSLLFIDVLTFRKSVEGNVDVRAYAQNLEYITINVTYHTLHFKEKNRNDEKLAQLFKSSLTFIDADNQLFDGTYRDQMQRFRSGWENNYFLDVACLTLWEENGLEYKESEFLYGTGKDLGFSAEHIGTAIKAITAFFEVNAGKIPFLQDRNFPFQFYGGMSRLVNKLIMRNSKRLQKELSQSKELMFLLSKSTRKELSPEEKKKVQKQLLDIFKSIPSLAIFILPGGAVLLPLVIKIIPQLLPSAFDDNRIEKRT